MAVLIVSLKERRKEKMMDQEINSIDEIVDKLFEQRGKLSWIIQQTSLNEEQEKAIKEAEVILDRVNQILKELGFGLPT